MPEDKNRNKGSELGIATKRPGDATHFAKKGATCRIHYEGKLDNGEIFDSSRARKKALLFKLGEGQLIPGLEQGIAKMSCGQICLFTIPPHVPPRAPDSAQFLQPAPLPQVPRLRCQRLPARRPARRYALLRGRAHRL